MKASLDILENFFHDCDQSSWGYSDSQIAAAETKLSVSFPKVLRQYYARFGTCPYIIQEGNNIPVMNVLDKFSIYHCAPLDADFLVFSKVSSVSAIDYGIRLSDFTLEDPPVYCHDYGNPSWILENPSLLNFLITAAFWQIAYEPRLDYYLSLNMNECDYDFEELPDLKCYVNALSMDGYELENLAVVCYYRIFIKDDVIFACLSDGEWESVTEPPCEDYAWLTATSNHREKIQAIQKIPELLWEEQDI